MAKLNGKKRKKIAFMKKRSLVGSTPDEKHFLNRCSNEKKTIFEGKKRKIAIFS